MFLNSGGERTSIPKFKAQFSPENKYIHFLKDVKKENVSIIGHLRSTKKSTTKLTNILLQKMLVMRKKLYFHILTNVVQSKGAKYFRLKFTYKIISA